MNKTLIGILFSVLILLGMTSCGEKKTVGSKLLLNEVLIDNQTNFQDDYGQRNAWIEIFNKSYGSVDLAGYGLKVSHQQGDTIAYLIPRGDVQTIVKPRQHALFWADGNPNRGTFHTKCTLDADKDNWIGLFDSGGNQIDEVVVPAGTLTTDQSYARVDDAANEWEVKGIGDTYVTPSTNNKTKDSNAKKEKFAEQDPSGIGMAISAMSVVFSGLVLLYISFRIIGVIAVHLGRRKTMKSKGINKHEAKEFTKVPGEVYAAIATALHEMQSDVHDVEETVLTISPIQRSYSPWSSKIYMLREIPRK